MKFSLFLPTVFQNLKNNTCTSSCTPTHKTRVPHWKGLATVKLYLPRKVCIKIIMHLTEYGAHLSFLFVL